MSGGGHLELLRQLNDISKQNCCLANIMMAEIYDDVS